jgi:uncharacterized RDD family membrane protein YckC
MSDLVPSSGWYQADGDPPNTERFWDGDQWRGDPQPLTGSGTTGALVLIPPDLEIGGPWRRIAGKLIDQVVLVGPLAGVALLVDRSGLVATDVVEVGFWLGLIGLFAFYNLLAVGLFATTVGKAVVGLRVVGPTGERASWGVATRRWLLQLAHVVPIVGAVAVVGIGVVSVVYLFTDPRRQTVHDRFARSFIVTASSMKQRRSSRSSRRAG